MNLSFARALVEDALGKGLRLHGVSIAGRPAISFDPAHPEAGATRRLFMESEGLLRELLRAAMIERCQQARLPLDIETPLAYAALAAESVSERVIH